MQYPNPTDLFANPFRYWTDVTLMQMEMTRIGWQMACAVNPLLPEGLFAAEVGIERGERTRKPAPRGAAARPVPLKTAPKPSNPAPLPSFPPYAILLFPLYGHFPTLDMFPSWMPPSLYNCSVQDLTY